MTSWVNDDDDPKDYEEGGFTTDSNEEDDASIDSDAEEEVGERHQSPRQCQKEMPLIVRINLSDEVSSQSDDSSLPGEK
jgi:hypothetical protein